VFFFRISLLVGRSYIAMVIFSHFFARAKKCSQRNHAKTFFPRKKVLESKKGAGSATKLTFVGSGTDGKAV